MGYRGAALVLQLLTRGSSTFMCNGPSTVLSFL
eukprot:CAMPEP_0174332738 /NCGR_PEP_ID=MMETSP0810-20121108/18545_1 /TAXON_ID=73025 ORGANISM="Eutreptiella gymnastica-like, Strain CCMP1594" /NCGR_SAMPLE_ID=MMETSP0810 /ASSEMBLY_ACC=CAM_ASM_000659 /LENGTH=32 /DNA_ID= /DNA_START= /DNA_END= /DNA_ORIENTATION=